MENEKKYNYIEKINELFVGTNVNETMTSKHNEPDLLKKYITDIRNLRILDKEMINNISKMSIENIIQIINTYNDVTDAFSKFIENIK